MSGIAKCSGPSRFFRVREAMHEAVKMVVIVSEVTASTPVSLSFRCMQSRVGFAVTRALIMPLATSDEPQACGQLVAPHFLPLNE